MFEEDKNAHARNDCINAANAENKSVNAFGPGEKLW
jgi:hypothetical protein